MLWGSRTDAMVNAIPPARFNFCRSSGVTFFTRR